MSRFQAFALVSCVGWFGAMLAPTLQADEWNKRTILTVNEPVQIPNKVLQPGKYVMKLLDSPSNRHIVQIFDENEQHLVTTVLAIPNYRLQPAGETQFGFWETPAGQPKAMRAWFYPGDNFGQEFAYPKNEATQIAANTNQPVPTTYSQSDSDLTTARATTTDQDGKESELPMQTAAQAPPPSAPQEMAQAAPPPQEGTADRAATPPAREPAPAQTLPHTASPYPMLALAGLTALAGYGILTVVSKRA